MHKEGRQIQRDGEGRESGERKISTERGESWREWQLERGGQRERKKWKREVEVVVHVSVVFIFRTKKNMKHT